MITVPIGASPLVSSQSDASYFHKSGTVSELYQQMREQASPAGRSVSSAAQLTSLCVDISPSSSHFYEVLYVGKLRVSHRRLPHSFIDDALERFLERRQERRASLEAGELEAAVPAEPEHNRTMVLQVGRTDLRLISPDRKLILLHKQHRDVASCVQGHDNPEHFGFLCRDLPVSSAAPSPAAYTGYVFKCESSSVAADAVNAISQAFSSQEAAGGGGTGAAGAGTAAAQVSSCEHCPMVWYHRLCAEVEHLSDRKTQAAIFRRIDQLDEEEQNSIVTKFKGAETDSIREQNEFLMMLLRAHCEMKQMRHVHDTAENRSEFLNQYLGGGSAIFMKAKRSLSNSFDHLLKRKGSRDDAGLARDLSLPLAAPQLLAPPSPGGGEAEGSRGASPEQVKSPMMDIFMKVGSSPRSSHSEEGAVGGGSEERASRGGGSWRQAIFNRVVTPARDKRTPGRSRSRGELRALWKRAIRQAVLLVRMERENARLRARQSETAVKRIKLEYDEMLGGARETSELLEVWESLLSARDPSEQLLQQSVRRGVPRARRGEVWHFLAELQTRRAPPPPAAARLTHYHTPYQDLLRQLTSHQHAILIDLGRTFPQHPYFSSPLGPGQLSLFNLLKAYSLLDPEVGYCQGLSFVAGVLLLHLEEPEAYRLLRHLMFRGLRDRYLPDMGALQVQLYQLSRLLHDRLPHLYEHLDRHEVAPTLYAAPWLLTLFASQFPLGFVARVLDLLFLEGPDVLFKLALALLHRHCQQLLACASFEEIMEYLKGPLAAVDAAALDGVTRHVFQMADVSRQLHEYRVEYQVLQEEMSSVRPQAEALRRLQAEHERTQEQNKQLAAQLELALQNVQRLERTRALQQAALNRLEVQSRGLEVSVATLGAFIEDLVERKLDVDIPGEVRRIVSQLAVAERRRAPASHLFRKPERQMVKSLSTGRIGLTPPDPHLPRSHSLNAQEGAALPGLRVISDEQEHQSNAAAPAPAKPTSLGNKMSHFFSSSHSHILQNKLSGGGQVIREDSREGLLSPPPDDKPVAPDFPAATATERTAEEAGEEAGGVSPTGSVDSGVGTPLSPKHPLSNCDVSFTFNGTTKLKNLRSINRNLSRNSSPDLLGK